MADIEDFEAWVKGKGGQKALAASIRKKFGEEIQISQTAISNWISRREVPVGKRAALKWAGWHGPYEWPEEVQEPAAPAAGYVTRAEFDALVVDYEDTCAVIQFLLGALPPETRPGVLPRRFRATP